MKSMSKMGSMNILAEVARDVNWRSKNGSIDCTYTYEDFISAVNRCDDKEGDPPTKEEHMNPAPPVVEGTATATQSTVRALESAFTDEPMPARASEEEEEEEVTISEREQELKKLSVATLKQMCKERGAILAPVTNKRDAHRIIKLFKTNNKTCDVSTDTAADYWIGLDVTYTKDEDEKVFSNGVKWHERKHSKIYYNYLKSPTNCAEALFAPHMHKSYPFFIKSQDRKCISEDKHKYLCLKPVEKASAEPISQKADSEINGVYIPSDVGLLLILVCVIVAYVRWQSVRKMKTEISELKEKVGMLESNASKNEGKDIFQKI